MSLIFVIGINNRNIKFFQCSCFHLPSWLSVPLSTSTLHEFFNHDPLLLFLSSVNAKVACEGRIIHFNLLIKPQYVTGLFSLECGLRKCFHSSSTCVCACWVASVMANPLQPYGLQAFMLLCPWDSPGKNIGSGLWFPPPGDLPDQKIRPRDWTRISNISCIGRQVLYH